MATTTADASPASMEMASAALISTNAPAELILVLKTPLAQTTTRATDAPANRASAATDKLALMSTSARQEVINATNTPIVRIQGEAIFAAVELARKETASSVKT